MPKIRVFADTNVILEAFRTGTWTAICQAYSIETVEKCIEEALTGDPNQPGRIPVDPATLIDGLAARHQIGKRELINLVLKYPHCQGLDDGELHLLAWLYANGLLPNALILVSTADKAAIVATNKLGWMDSLTSLEQIAQKSGVTRSQIDNLAQHYRADWLEEIKVKVILGVIP